MRSTENFLEVPSGSAAGDGGTAAAGGQSSAASPSPDTEVTVPTAGTAGGVHAKHPEGSEEGGVPVAGNAPPLESLQNQQCPNCTVGVLYVIEYDPDALHEKGQDHPVMGGYPSMPQGYESGGAYRVQCFACNWRQSFALNPGKYHGTARG